MKRIIQIDRHTDQLTNTPTDRHRNWILFSFNRQTDRQTNGQTYRQTDQQTNRQTNRQTEPKKTEGDPECMKCERKTEIDTRQVKDIENKEQEELREKETVNKNEKEPKKVEENPKS